MKNLRKQMTGAGMILLLIVMVVTACSSNDPSPPVTNTAPKETKETGGKEVAQPVAKPFDGKSITLVTANHPWGDTIKALISEFEAETGIKVNVQSYFEDQLTQRLTVQFTTGSATPDVFMYRPLQEGKLFYKNGWLHALDEYVAKDANYDFEDFSKAAIGTTTVDGALAGIPIITEQEILYYRKDLLQDAGIQVPTTIDELVDAVKQLHDPQNEMYGFVARGQTSALVTQVSSFLYSEGGDFMDGDQATVNTPEAIKGFTTYGTLLRDYGPPGVLNMSWPQAIGIFAQGKVAFYTDANSLYQNAIDPEKSTIAEHVGYAVFPAGDAGSRPYDVTSWGLAVNANSVEKDAAWEFIQWATSKESMLETQKAGNPGPRASVWDNPEGTAGFPEQLVEVTKESLKNGVGHDRPLVISVGEARDIVGEIVQRIILDDGDIQAVADRVNNDLQNLIDKDNTK